MVEIDAYGNSLTIKTDSDTLRNLRNSFSIEGPNIGKQVSYDTRKYAITPSGSFFPGMMKEIQDYCTIKKIECTITKEASKKFQPSIVADDPTIGMIIERVDGLDYRDYQLETIQNMFSRGRGVALLPTSAGKTAVMGGFCKTYLKYKNGKIVIAVPNKILLNQTYNDFLSFGITDVDKYSGEDKDTDWNKSIIIATFAKLVQRKKVKNPDKKGVFKDSKTFDDFDVVIVDEVHQLHNRENNILKFLARIKTDNKFGLTGTLPESKFGVWNIVGRIGPVLYKKDSIELRKAGNITDVQVKVIKFIHKRFVYPDVQPGDSPSDPYIREKVYLNGHKKRNSWVVELCNKADNNILILLDRIEHGEALKTMLEKRCEDKHIFFANGSTPTEQRDEIKKIMEENDNVVCVAITKLFSTGVSINNLPWVVMMGIGKSKVQLFQTIGRSLRLHKNKKIATIFDIADNTYYSQYHLGMRLEYYKNEQIESKIKEIGQ